MNSLWRRDPFIALTIEMVLMLAAVAALVAAHRIGAP